MKKDCLDGNPPKTDCLAAEVEGGFDEVIRLPARLERYAKAHERAVINLAHVQDTLKKLNGGVLFHHDNFSADPAVFRLQKVATRMRNCGDYLTFRHYYTVGKVRLHAACFCKVHLLCPLCAVRRGSKMLEVLLEKYHLIMSEHKGLKPYFLTLTVKNGDDLTERHEHLKAAFQRLLDRRRTVKKGNRGKSQFGKIEGLFGTYEVTKPSDWHPHMHLVVLVRGRIDIAALKQEWFDITGDSHVMNIKPFRNPKDPAKDFLEICKYALKYSDLTPKDNLDAFIALSDKRLVVTAGLFWGLKIPEELTDIPLEELPYFELFYKYLPGSGYNLTDRETLVA